MIAFDMPNKITDIILIITTGFGCLAYIHNIAKHITFMKEKVDTLEKEHVELKKEVVEIKLILREIQTTINFLKESAKCQNLAKSL